MTGTFMAADRIPEPCALVIFGASGDLTRRKLAPAIWHLAQQGRLPKSFTLVGVARRPIDDVRFRAHIREALDEFVDELDAERLDAFLSALYYVRGEPDDPQTYAALRARLEALDQDRGRPRR